MNVEERKMRIIDATMQVVAERGLESFSVLQVAKKVGINEALVYRDFGTKEHLLYVCYHDVAQEVAILYNATRQIDMSSTEAVICCLHDIWLKYFMFLVRNGHKTIYYLSYRDSEHIHTYLEKENREESANFDAFLHLIQPLLQAIPLPCEMNMDYVWTYIMDTSAIFAKKIIRGELPNSLTSYENIWNLLSKGIQGLLEIGHLSV